MSSPGFFSLILALLVRVLVFLYLLLFGHLPFLGLGYPVRSEHILLYWGWFVLDIVILQIFGFSWKGKAAWKIKKLLLSLEISFSSNVLAYVAYEFLRFGNFWGPFFNAIMAFGIYSLVLFGLVLVSPELFPAIKSVQQSSMSQQGQEIAGFLVLPIFLTISLFMVAFVKFRDFLTLNTVKSQISLLETVENYAFPESNGSFVLSGVERSAAEEEAKSLEVFPCELSRLFMKAVGNYTTLYISDEEGRWFRISRDSVLPLKVKGSATISEEFLMERERGLFAVVPFKLKHLSGYLLVADDVVFGRSSPLLVSLLLIISPLVVFITLVFFVLQRDLLKEAGELLEEVSDFVEALDFSRELEVKGPPGIRKLREGVNDLFCRLARLLRMSYDDLMENSALLSESVKAIELIETEFKKPVDKIDISFVRELSASLKEAFTDMVNKLDYSAQKFGRLRLPVRASEMHLTMPESPEENR